MIVQCKKLVKFIFVDIYTLNNGVKEKTTKQKED